LEIVKTDDKQRYAVKEIDGVPHVRANQGHSIPVIDLDFLFISCVFII
jgi:RNA:NAD 2'-phosphotransferase (TPT1/KptA family)